MNFGWIEIALFYGIAIGFGAWQWLAMDRKLKQTRAEKSARAEAGAEDENDSPDRTPQ